MTLELLRAALQMKMYERVGVVAASASAERPNRASLSLNQVISSSLFLLDIIPHKLHAVHISRGLDKARPIGQQQQCLAGCALS